MIFLIRFWMIIYIIFILYLFETKVVFNNSTKFDEMKKPNKIKLIV